MKKVLVPRVLVVAILSSLVSFGCANGNNKAEQNGSSATVSEASTELEKVGYSIGFATATSYKQDLDDLNIDTFEQGVRDAYAEKEPVLSMEQMQEIMTEYEKRKKEEKFEEMKKAAVENKAEGDKFLAANAKKEGIITTESGLQYRVIKPGTGKPVTASDIIKMNYEGKLIDGTIFDSSYGKEGGESKPVMAPVQGMIPGFSEGLQLMKEGAEYEFYIPADLAYGETGNEGIDPNSTLIFKIEVLEVNPKMPEVPKQPQQPQPVQ